PPKATRDQQERKPENRQRRPHPRGPRHRAKKRSQTSAPPEPSVRGPTRRAGKALARRRTDADVLPLDKARVLEALAKAPQGSKRDLARVLKVKGSERV